MKLFLDTHLLLWAAGAPGNLSRQALDLIENEENTLLFSPASIWEVVIKSSLGRADFQVDATLLRTGLIDNGYIELPITSAHTLMVGSLTGIHRDPFDRIMIAQTISEGILMLTSDSLLGQYSTSIRVV
ncbi:MAG: PIN domain nuclease, a component of toxin-antitoxin system (PIN domain) [Candidatus Kentron sp. G]|nr:MAG: PIN domain nuclease, a component of toxin-antitoxin system (PIN domain) [Candidatus Kentron sp. G]VFN00007.1 MAG: PIN domain nuclease, a component of toxin-antitoxin system (PIN domain) [Candidatus Kentron sp. G]VFN01925.1 MAG: PIN domain nuclease, a component of toxin-antitoxin system (PIN domain) [Candidatus Kentron sp. G]